MLPSPQFFTSDTCFQEYKDLEMRGKVWRNKDTLLVEQDQAVEF